jgi:hypothetical protein
MSTLENWHRRLELYKQAALLRNRITDILDRKTWQAKQIKWTPELEKRLNGVLERAYLRQRRRRDAYFQAEREHFEGRMTAA